MSKDVTQINRVVRSKEAAKASYDMWSRWYDVLAGWGEKKFRKVGLEKLRAREGEKVLEIRFGTGHCTLARSANSTGKVYGLDISEGMCKVTQSRVEQAGLAKRVELKLGDAARLPFEASSFDAVFMSFTPSFSTCPKPLSFCSNAKGF